MLIKLTQHKAGDKAAEIYINPAEILVVVRHGPLTCDDIEDVTLITFRHDGGETLYVTETPAEVAALCNGGQCGPEASMAEAAAQSQRHAETLNRVNQAIMEVEFTKVMHEHRHP